MDEIKIPMSRPDFGKEEFDNISKIFDSDWFSEGETTNLFETELSKYLSNNVVAVNNGTSALLCALLAHGIGPGDNVIVPAFTFIATCSVPKILGANVLVADIEADTLNIDPNSVESLLEKNNVKAVLPVDVAGQSINLKAFEDLSEKYDFAIIEDAAEALGSEYNNRKIGSFSHTTIFSFHIAKLITTIEGGCISTSDKNILEKISKIKNQGSGSEKYVHDELGLNLRTTDLQSALGLAQLKKIDTYLSLRNNIAKNYKEKLEGFEFQKITPYATQHSNMLFFCVAENQEKREQIRIELNKKGIDSRKAWLPVHMQPCNPELKKFNCPNAESAYHQILTLPMYNSMTDEESQYIIDSCNEISNVIEN